MDLLQAAVKTFDANADLVGVLRDGDREPLCPIAHYILKSSIEIELDEFGGFVSASKVEEANCKIILPCTEPSATRTSNVAAHPLCDRLEYLVSMTVKEEKETGNSDSDSDNVIGHVRLFCKRRFIHQATLVIKPDTERHTGLVYWKFD